MLTIKTWRDPYDAGFSPTTPTKIELEPGITVLVGCNGAGKSTLLENIKEMMKKEDIPCIYYNNLNDGGGFARESAFFLGDMSLGVNLFFSSEGEAIKINFGEKSKIFRSFLKDGIADPRRNRISESFRQAEKLRNGETCVEEEKKELSNKRLFLFDAIDSGLSVDSVVEIKEILHFIKEDAEKLGVEVYIVVSANEYELARNERCFDVNNGKYVAFEDYEAYRTFILKSRERKEKRIQKQEVWLENKKRKQEEAIAKRKAKYEPMIEKIKEKAEKENRNLSWSEKDKIRNYERLIETGSLY